MRELVELLASAFDAQRSWKLGYRDSLIVAVAVAVAVAQRSGAPVQWSEDLADGQHYG